MNNFLILGLPRSRTAWLANFMTHDGFFCSHEGLNGCPSLFVYRDKFTNGMGDSNTGLALFDFEPLFTTFKKVIIDSDIDSAVAFSKKHYSCDSTRTMIAMQSRLNSLDGLHVHFNDINQRLEDIWTYITDLPFNTERAKMLMGFDVQVRNIHDFDCSAMARLRESTDDYFPPQAKFDA